MKEKHNKKTAKQKPGEAKFFEKNDPRFMENPFAISFEGSK